jgi:hypothetical protein
VSQNSQNRDPLHVHLGWQDPPEGGVLQSRKGPHFQ